MTNNRSTFTRPQRIPDELKREVDNLNQFEFRGKLSFSRACEVYVDKNRKLQEEIEKLKRQNDSRRGRLV